MCHCAGDSMTDLNVHFSDLILQECKSIPVTLVKFKNQNLDTHCSKTGTSCLCLESLSESGVEDC